MPRTNMLRLLAGRLFAGGEESVLKECSKILRIAQEANASLRTFAGSKLDMASIRRLEQKADGEKFRIANMITSGAVAPNVLDNMLLLLGHHDNIVNSIYNLARELCRYGVRDEEEARYIRTQVAEVVQLVDSALETLLAMYEQEDVTKLRSLRQTIEHLEETGDNVKESMLDLAYARPATFQSFYHVVQTAHLADNVLDGCEDSADALLTIIASVIT
ncbi:MAG TPA: DUF47 family protein [bacterium]|nr:DUF47 family protein [bacterium]